MSEYLSRTIKFYYIDLGVDEAGRRVPLSGQKLHDMIDAASKPKVQTMKYNIDHMYVSSHGHDTSPRNRSYYLSMTRVRSRNMPQFQMENDLEPLPEGSRLGERSHMIIFDGNVLGVEFNNDAPRVKALLDFIEHVSPGFLPVESSIKPVIDKSVAEKILALDEVTLVDILIDGKSVNEDMISEGDDLRDAFKALKHLGVPQFKVVLKRQGSKGSVGDRAKESLRRLFKGKGDASLLSFVEKLKVKGRGGDDERIQEYDFHNTTIQKRGVQIKCVPQSSSTSRVDAFEAIQGVYNEMDDAIRNSVPICVND